MPGAFMEEGNTLVTLRFGSEPPVQEHWAGSVGGGALYYPGGRQRLKAFVRKLARYDRLVIRVSPYDEAPKALVFMLAGIDKAQEELWAACK
jgi:hypothetical protein